MADDGTPPGRGTGPAPRTESGPLRLPGGHRGRDPRWAWLVALGVVVLGLVLYAATRPAGSSANRLRNAPAPSWGSLTLAQVVRAEATAAGEAHPKDAVWTFTHRPDALRLLNGQTTTDTSADYLVVASGQFKTPAKGPILSGSLPGGSYLVLLVRAFDGTVSGIMIAGAAPQLATLGIVHPLRFGVFG